METPILLSEYIQLPREERTAHINMESECQQQCTRKTALKKAFETLCQIHNIANNIQSRGEAGIHTCHLCLTPNCSNPEHTYIGTISENFQDVPEADRSERARKREARMTPEQKQTKSQKISRALKGVPKGQTKKQEGLRTTELRQTGEIVMPLNCYYFESLLYQAGDPEGKTRKELGETLGISATITNHLIRWMKGTGEWGERQKRDGEGGRHRVLRRVAQK